MRVAIAGMGPAGATLACLLADAGVTVTLIEREADPEPVGAGIWLQELGQRVLDRIGLRDALAAMSATVSRVHMVTPHRTLVDTGYEALPGSVPALGVHRGELFDLLWQSVATRGVETRLGVPVTGCRPTPAGITVETAAGDLGAFDLVVGADGARSAVRRSINTTVRDRPYAYGALWTVVDDPAGLAGSTLYQSMDGTRSYLGVLPTGASKASIFWSVRVSEAPSVIEAGIEEWRRSARRLAGPFEPLVDRAGSLVTAAYRDVVVSRPFRLDGSNRGAVLIGDAAHAMSPQLGVGTSLALADAATLADSLVRHPRVDRALSSYADARRAHVRWYAWLSRSMMPAFQSHLDWLAPARDRLAAPVMRIPGVERLAVGTLCGDRVGPFRRVS